MPFFIAHDPQEHTPGYVEVWPTAYPTREAATAALRVRAREHGSVLEAAYLIVVAPTYEAAVEQIRAQIRAWSR
jgi:hypothetical protein